MNVCGLSIVSSGQPSSKKKTSGGYQIRRKCSWISHTSKTAVFVEQRPADNPHRLSIALTIAYSGYPSSEKKISDGNTLKAPGQMARDHPLVSADNIGMGSDSFWMWSNYTASRPTNKMPTLNKVLLKAYLF